MAKIPKKAATRVTRKAAVKKTAIAKKTVAPTPVTFKVCQKCYAENSPAATICKVCGSKKFAPEFIKKIDKVIGNTLAQVTLPQGSDEQRITLYKWWPGGKSSFNINTIEQWEKIVEVIQTKLLPFLGWQSKAAIVKEISAKGNEVSEKKIKQITSHYPELIRRLLQQIDVTQWEENSHEDLTEILKEISELLAKTDAGFRYAFMDVIKHLPKEGKRAIEDLAELLKSWSLKQLTSISTQVIDRIQTLELFKDRVLDDKTYEIRGEDSIHRILERAMWIIDERYWLLHSNATLRTIVGDEVVKQSKGNEKKRPDFVCGSVGEKLIIVELKRPSHALEIDDLNQLENYLSIIEDKHPTKTLECYLIGKSISVELAKKKKFRGAQFKVRTFSELIDDTEKRYKDFMKALS